jgi:hypothetical protein
MKSIFDGVVSYATPIIYYDGQVSGLTVVVPYTSFPLTFPVTFSV